MANYLDKDGFLTGPGQAALAEILQSIFQAPPRLLDFLNFRLNKSLWNYQVMGGGFDNTIANLVSGMNGAFEWRDLVREARNAAPRNPRLLAFEQATAQGARVGVATEDPEWSLPAANLELKITESGWTFDIQAWRQRLGEIEGRVCRFERPDRQARGTGFLVGPDLVLTNYHVVEDLVTKEADPTEVVLRFDYKMAAQGAEVSAGQAFKLATDWAVLTSPYSPRDLEVRPASEAPVDQLDYAFLRVVGRPGDSLVGGPTQDTDPVRRGWIRYPRSRHDFKASPAMYIVQHPDGQPMRVALDTNAFRGLNANSARVRYATTTEPGSSGSPVFGADWSWIALHHAGDPKYYYLGLEPEYNQGIPVSALVADLARLGRSELLQAV